MGGGCWMKFGFSFCLCLFFKDEREIKMTNELDNIILFYCFIGIIPPENFEVLKPITFEVNGEEHEQAVYFNDENKEAILYSPAHSGYPAITTVLTSKNGTKKAKSLTCDDDTCHLNDVLDELYLDPEIIAHVYKLYENSTTKSNKVRVDAADGVKINYVVRSNHQAISESEQQELPESMKAVSTGKMIFVSNVTIENERPDVELTFDNNNTQVQKAWCGFKVDNKNYNIIHACTFTFHYKMIFKIKTLNE